MTSAKLYENMDLESLKKEIRTLDSLINEIECFGANDLIRRGLALQELKNRGLKVVTKTTLEFEEIKRREP